MRLVYVGNFGAPHSTENEVRKALEHLRHEVVPVQENELDWRHLAERARVEGADAVLWTHTHGFAPEATHAAQQAALGALRDLGIPTVAYHLDRWWGLEREQQVTEPFFTCDLVVTADGGHQAEWEALGVNHRWLPPAIGHAEVGRGRPDELFRADVAFVGGWRGYGHAAVWPWRNQLIHHLQRRWGDRLGLWPAPGAPAIRGRRLRDLYASVRVVVGDSCLAGGATHYWSDRIPETLGRGGFLIHPQVDGLWDWFPSDREVPGYAPAPPRWPSALPWTFDVGDLAGVDLAITAALELSDAERRRLTDEAIDWVRELHTYVQRMEQVTEWIEEL